MSRWAMRRWDGGMLGLVMAGDELTAEYCGYQQ